MLLRVVHALTHRHGIAFRAHLHGLPKTFPDLRRRPRGHAALRLACAASPMCRRPTCHSFTSIRVSPQRQSPSSVGFRTRCSCPWTSKGTKAFTPLTRASTCSPMAFRLVSVGEIGPAWSRTESTRRRWHSRSLTAPLLPYRMVKPSVHTNKQPDMNQCRLPCGPISKAMSLRWVYSKNIITTIASQ